MNLLLNIMSLFGIVLGLIYMIQGEFLATAIFWIASSGFKVAESIYNLCEVVEQTHKSQSKSEDNKDE